MAEATKKEDVPGNDDNSSMMDFGLEDDTIGDACAVPGLEEDQVCTNGRMHRRVHYLVSTLSLEVESRI